MTDDPTLVDTKTLLESLKRDIIEANTANQQADLISTQRWLTQASITVHELQKREARYCG